MLKINNSFLNIAILVKKVRDYKKETIENKQNNKRNHHINII